MYLANQISYMIAGAGVSGQVFNSLQFNDKKDYHTYPRTSEIDKKLPDVAILDVKLDKGDNDGIELLNHIKKTPEYLQSVAAIWLILVALTIFAEVTFRNLGIFLGADQIVQNSVPAIVFLQVPFAIASGTMLRTTLIYDFFKKRGKMIINIISYVIGIMLFVGIAVGGWTDMIKGWEIGEYQGIGAIEFPVYPIRTVIIFSSIIVVFIYLSLIVKSFMSDK